MSTRAKLMIGVLVLQLGLLLAPAINQELTLRWGHTAELRVRPVDPFAPLSGYYVILNLEIATPMGFRDAGVPLTDGTTVYTVIVPAKDGACDALRMSVVPPTLSANERLIVGTYENGRIKYGVEQCFIPEEKREEIEQGLANGNLDRRAVVRIDKNGNAALHGLRIGTKYY